MSTLEAALRDCLPQGIGFEKVSREGPGFVFVFLDAAKHRRTVDFWPKDPSRRAFRQGRHFAFAYRPRQEEPHDTALEQQVMGALLAQEERLWANALSFVETSDPLPLPGRPLFLRETTFALQILRTRRNAKNLEQAVHVVFDQALATEAGATELHFYFETQCAQACEFCEEPQTRRRIDRRAVNRLLVMQHDLHLDIVSSGAWQHLLHAANDRQLPITITGHDWTKHPHREALLRILESLRSARIRLQGPSLAFDSLAFAQRVAALPGLEWIATTLQSSIPAEHDAMVGAPGAFARLIPALENLKKLGIRVQLTLVLTRRAVRSLATTLEFLHARNWFVELAAFVPDRAMTHILDKLAPLDELRRALEQVPLAARDVVQSLVGVPPCATPEALRSRVRAVLPTKERARPDFGATCHRCRAFSSCSGVPAGYAQALGDRGMVPING